MLQATGYPGEIACVASVSVWFRSKEIPRKGTFGIDHARNETRAKSERGGRGKGRKETLADKPLDLKTCVRQRRQRLTGSPNRTMLTCVDQRFVSY